MADLFSGQDGQTLQLSEALNTVAYVLRGLGYEKTVETLMSEAEERNGDIELGDPQEVGETIDRLDSTIANILRVEAARKLDESTVAVVGDQSGVVSSDSESESSSSSEEFVKVGDKRKREASPEDSSSDSSSDSDSTSSSDSDSGSDSNSDDSRPLKRVKHTGGDETKVFKKQESGKKKVVKTKSNSSSSESSSSDDSDSDTSSSDGSSSSSSDSGSSSASSSDDSSSSDSGSSSSDSDSSSESDSESSSSPSPSPPPKKAKQKKQQKEKKQEKDKSKKAKKDADAKPQIFSSIGVQKPISNESAASSVTLTATSPQQPASNLLQNPDTMLVLDTGIIQVPATTENVKLLKDKAVFKRVPVDTAVDPKFSSNAYVPYDYANRAYQDLSVTKGKGFTKEKNKKKRGKLDKSQSASSKSDASRSTTSEKERHQADLDILSPRLGTFTGRSSSDFDPDEYEHEYEYGDSDFRYEDLEEPLYRWPVKDKDGLPGFVNDYLDL